VFLRTLFVTVVALLVSIGVARAQSDTAASATVAIVKFDPKRGAASDIDAGVAVAKATGKRVLLDVGGEWCVWCRRLDTLFATNKALAEFRDRNYVTVKVNYSKENKNEAVLSRYPKVKGYPHLFVLDGNGSLLHSQDTGELESGKGHDPEKVMAFLKKWAPATGEQRE
jgi:thiol:disulfide interchange protein